MGKNPSSPVFNRRYVDPHLSAVALAGFKPSALSLSILRAVNECTGTSNSLMVGGALTAEYNDASPRDYDVHLSYPETKAALAANDDHFCPPDTIMRDIVSDIEASEHFKLINGPTFLGYGASTTGSVVFEFEGKIVDISMRPEAISLSRRALYGDAILNSVAMNSKGHTLAHPRFEEDMENQDWTIRVTGEYDHNRAVDRFDRRAEHLENFTLTTAAEYQVQLTQEL